MNTATRSLTAAIAVVALLAHGTASAKQWSVSNDTLAPAQFDELQAAVDSADVGDTLLVAGTGTSYGDVIIDKPLVLIGAGYTPEAQATIVDAMNIRSSGVSIAGFDADIRLDAFNALDQTLANVRVTRSMGPISLFGSNTPGAGLFSHVAFTECIISGVALGNGFDRQGFTFDSLLFSNNIFSSRFAPDQAGFSSAYVGTETIVFDHNDLLSNPIPWGGFFWSQFEFSPGPAWPEGAMVVSNNIFRGTGPRGCPNCCFINNMSYCPDSPGLDSVLVQPCDTVNYWNENPGIPAGTFDMDNDYTLPNGSLAIDNASDGTDIGITGGLTLFVVGTPPPGPKVDYVNVDEVAVPPDGLFHYQVQAHAFGTPGVLLDSLEYLIDVDGGIGTGTSIALQATSTLDLFAEAFALDLDSGAHRFGVRVRDQSGAWSTTKWTALAVCNAYGPEAAFDLYRTGTTVSFVDQSRYASGVVYEFGDGGSATGSNPSHTYAVAGAYPVLQIATSECGVDTLVRTATISGISGYWPGSGSNTGYCTITLNGAGFTPEMEFRLLDGSLNEILPDTIYTLSGTQAFVMLNLIDATTGSYAIELDLPGDTLVHIDNGFAITEEVENGIVTVVHGPPAMRQNSWVPVEIEVWNSGPVDVYAVPVYVANTDGLDIQWDIETFVPDTLGMDSIPTTLPLDTVGGRPFQGELGAWVIPWIPANSRVYIRGRMRTQLVVGAGEILCWTDGPMYGNELGGFESGSVPLADTFMGFMECLGCFIDPTDLIPGYSCGKGVWDAVVPPYVAAYKGKPLETVEILEFFPPLGSMIINCTAGEVPFVGDVVAKILRGVMKGHDLIEQAECVFNECLPPTARDYLIGFVNSIDPNAKYGDQGYAPERYVTDDRAFTYVISFENLASAAVAAQRVVINDTLDASALDLRRAHLGDIGIGDTVYLADPLATSMAKTVALGNGYELRLNATIDTSTAVAHWDIFIADAVLHALPDDPLVGFLPPNITSPEGQGFVTLHVPLRSGLPHEQTIANEASIIFDANAPIITEQWMNTIDSEPPTSAVDPLPALSLDTAILVSWNGSDANSGIAYYEVYASSNTAVGYDLWVVTDDLSATFVGDDQATYHFYSIAVDSVGNREVKEPTSEAITVIDMETGIDPLAGLRAHLDIYPNPSATSITISGSTTSPCVLQAEFRNAMGQLVLSRSVSTGAGSFRSVVDISGLEAGAYIGRITCAGTELVKRVIKVGNTSMR